MLYKLTRIGSIGIVLIFGLNLTGVGAVDLPGCGMSHCRGMMSVMSGSSAAPYNHMGLSPSAAAGGCCSGSQNGPCDVGTSTPLDIKTHTVALTTVPTGDPTAMGLIAVGIPAGNVHLRSMGSPDGPNDNPRSSPIYLQNLSLLI
ncbi:MAG: hypothetical protein V3S89_03350 [Desulfobacterales bacterium]